MNYVEEVEQLIASVKDETGSKRSEAIKKAIRIADTHQDVRLGLKARIEGIFDGLNVDEMMVAFSWVWSQLDQHPELEEEVDIWKLLFRYKSAPHYACKYPTLTREKIYRIMDDVIKRFRKYGYGEKPLYRQRCRIAMSMKDKEMARDYYQLWKTSTEDGNLEDCRACVTRFEAHYHLWLGELDQALELAKPIFQKELQCRGIDESFYSPFLLPLLQAGRLEEAKRLHQKGFKKVFDEEWVADGGYHLQFLVLTDQMNRATRLFKKLIGTAFKAPREPWEEWYFFLGGRLYLKKLLQLGRKKIKIDTTTPLPVRGDARNFYRIDELAECFYHELKMFADQMDARNRNDWYNKKIEENESLLEKISLVRGK
ncbi:hypothetical protein [Thermoflavimicrobium dichotomicum]|uniref:Uncharacterized protein n=1 Tax=Thermoflavimicrobium dichotomicum TaxID=46223 RepID=A0A1I3QS45_9BACL|nr:hypothetical protein [Thermoflavimicrobium dichotomicum]SFJ36262.1 hypothetical protein SAMN05421852_10856 [Thermoflavimicrobium dichotomicum]